MKKTYLVKKNPNMPESEDNWIVMNGFEFARFMETPEGQRRKGNFGQLDACGEGDDIIVAECGEDSAKQWRAEKDAHDYLVEQEIESGIETLSFDALDSEDDETIGEELMVDEDCDVVADVMRKLDREKLALAIKSLNPDEYQLMYEMFISDEQKSERDIAKEKGLCQKAINKRKAKILKKMKKYF